jgi:ribosome-binding protein aMBF1 (putative translation factor)
MSNVNKKILKSIEDGDFAPEIKELLRSLLVVEARNAEDKKPRYSEDYDRIIKKLAENRGYKEEAE